MTEQERYPWELSDAEILALLPDDTREQIEQFPAEVQAFLLKEFRKRIKLDMQQKMRTAIQRDPSICEQARDQMAARLTVNIANELLKQSDTFEVGDADTNPPPAWQQPQSGVLAAGYLIIASRFLLRGGNIGSLVIITVLLIVLMLSAVKLSKRLAKNDEKLFVDRDTLRRNNEQWRWQDITEIRFLRLGRIRIFAGDQIICTISVNEKNADRLVRYAEMRGVTVTGEDQS